nr:unnamed protein product [Callosobruchus analis]
MAEDGSNHLEKYLEKLSLGVLELQQVVGQLAEKVQGQQQVEIGSDKLYISYWRELGESSIYFNPNGRIHPKAFLNKINKIFEEASVPEKSRISLAISCLRGSAIDWATAKEHSFINFKCFESAFLDRFWGVERQRDLFLELSYGQFQEGSRAEYFMNLASQASYLSEPIPEEKLISMLSHHFQPEIQRGIITQGSHKIDDVERYLSRIDDTYSFSSANQRNVSNQNWRESQARHRTNVQTSQDTSETVDNQSRNIRVITKFNEDPDEILSDTGSDTSECHEKPVPLISASIENIPISILIDTGSEISAISADMHSKIINSTPLPILPVTSTSIVTAIGGKKQRVSHQVLLTVKITCPGRDNVIADTLSRFPTSNNLGIVPENSSDIRVMLTKLTCILSDNGTQYTSKAWTTTLTNLGIKCKFISLYFPEGNLTERYNKEVGRLIRAYCYDKHTKWATMLDFVEDCLNNSISEPTGYTPLYLQFGKKVEHPISKYVSYPEGGNDAPIEQVWILARERMLSKAEKRANKFNSTIKPVQFAVGDQVLIRTHRQSSLLDRTIRKFFLLYEGPFVISRVAGPNSYEIHDLEGRFHSKQNIVNLKGYKSPLNDQ